MKKILSLLMLMLLCTTAWAAEETIGLTAEAQGYENGDLVTTVEGDVVTLTFDKAQSSTAPAYYSTGDAVRLYKGGTLTISAAGNTITQVVFVYELNGNATVSVSPGSYDANTKTWTGSALEVVLTAATEKHVRISQVTVTYEISETPALASPTILLNGVAPANSYYVSDLPLSLTITSNNGTVTPYYHYSFADDPETVSSTIRAGATELTTGESSALNLKLGSNKLWVAEAIQNSETQQWTSSQWASATFTIKDDPTTVANIAALTELANGTDFRMVDNWSATVVYVNGNYLYIKDNTGYSLIFKSTAEGIAAGNTISNLKGTVSIYNNLFEVGQGATYNVDNTTTDLVAPTEYELSTITSADNMNEYVVVKGVTLSNLSGKKFDIIKGETTIQGYLNFNNISYPGDGIYDVEGFVGVYNTTLQLYPTSFDPVETPVEFGVTVSPEAGEYTEPVTVTITATDANAVIKYTLNGGDEITYTEPFTLNETTAVSVTATLGEEVATWTGTYTINIPVPITLDGKIVFKDNDTDGTANLDSDGIIAEMTKGADLVGNVSDVSKIYAGKTGLKLSSSKDNGSMKLNLKNKWNATKIAVIAKAWSGTSGVDDASISVNGNVFPLTGEFQKFEVPFTEATEIQAITIAATKRAYLKVVDIEGEEGEPSGPTYTITLDKQPGEYSTLINVKATVEPALPEGATLKYTIDGAAPVAYDAEKGVYLLKSSELKFTAYDAQNNPLTDPVGGQYKYIVNVFGDMDGDGEVTVSDLNIVLNLILGKI